MSNADAYLDARSAFDRVAKEVGDVAKMLHIVAGALERNPGKFSFSNTQPGLPPEAVLSRNTPSITAADWKSAHEIQEMLSRWHDAREAMLELWNGIPHDRRPGLQPPPTLTK
jgi:hypothetical protein